MKVMARIFAMMVLLALVIAAPLAAQSSPQQPPPPPAKQPAAPGQPGAQPATPEQPAGPPVNKEEEDAYKAFFETKDDALKAKLGEEFQTKYPTSRYLESVYATLSNTYQNLGQDDKMFAAGEKTLEMNPNNIAALVTMTKALSRKTDPTALDAQQKFDKVEKYGKKALEILPTLPKPAGMEDAKFEMVKADALADIHSGLGLMYLRRQRIAESIAELDQATKVTKNPDPVDYYLLGIVLQAVKRYDEAVAAYKSCTELPSQLKDTCKAKQGEAEKQAAAKPATPAPPKP